jgi:hypothetical protein
MELEAGVEQTYQEDNTGYKVEDGVVSLLRGSEEEEGVVGCHEFVGHHQTLTALCDKSQYCD